MLRPICFSRGDIWDWCQTSCRSRLQRFRVRGSHSLFGSQLFQRHTFFNKHFPLSCFVDDDTVLIHCFVIQLHSFRIWGYKFRQNAHYSRDTIGTWHHSTSYESKHKKTDFPTCPTLIYILALKGSHRAEGPVAARLSLAHSLLYGNLQRRSLRPPCHKGERTSL